MMIVASNSITVSNVNDGTILHTAYAYSADGTDRFTTVYPEENLYLNSKAITGGSLTGGPTRTVEPFDDTTNMWHIVAKQGNGTVGIYFYKYANGKIPNNSIWSYSADVKGTGKINIFGVESGKHNPVVGTISKEWSRVSQTGQADDDSNKSIVMYFDTTDSPLDIYIKLPKLEIGTMPTPWTPSASEAITDDYPSYIGQYTDFTQADSTNPSDYTWSLMRGKDGEDGKDGIGIKSTIITYQLSSSGTVTPAGTWLTTVPTLTKGQYLWTRTTLVYTDNTNKDVYSVSYVAKDGNNGTDGVAGKAGVGIKSTTITYQSGTSGTVQPTGTWVANPPSVTGGNYLWTRTVWTYTDGTTETGYSVGHIGANGNNGADGVGVKSTTITYQASTSGTTAPTGTWVASPPSVADGNYLWTQTTWLYTDGTSKTGYSVAKIGEKGDKGDQGIPGATGDDGKTSYLHIAYANNADGSGCTTSPDINSSYNYIGTYTDYTSTSSTNPSSYKWVAMFDSTKKRNFTTQPTTPYAVGDTWIDRGSATYFCTTARNSGAFTASDWTMQQLTIASLDSSIQTNLNSSVKTTGNYKGVTLNDAGLTATAGSTTVAMNSNDGFLINKAGNEVFHVDTSGNLTMQGNITAGNISGVNFTGNSLNLNGTLAIGANGVLSANGGKTVINNSGLTIKDGGLSVEDSKGNQTTYVGSDGTLITNKGYFVGTVTTSALNVTGSNSDINLGGGKFHVDKNGNLTANSATLVNGTINSATLNSATINSPDIIVPFDSFDASQNEYKGTMEFKDGLIKHISTMADGGMLKTLITPIGYELNAYANQSEYTKNNPFIHSELYADNISVSNAYTKKSGILDSSGIAGTLNNGTDQSTNVSVSWEDVQKYLSEMSDTGSTRAFDWFDIMSSVQSHPNLIRNSSFINGQTNWDGFNDQCYMANVTHDGNFAVCIESAGGGNFISQNLSHIPDPGHQLCVSYWGNIDRDDGDFNGGMLISFQGTNSNYVCNVSTVNPSHAHGWHFYTYDPITVPNGTTGIRISFYNNEHTGNKIYYAQPMISDGATRAPYMPTY